ncbi:MAG: Bacterial regulatory protein luxR family [Bacteroidota bacterium]
MKNNELKLLAKREREVFQLLVSGQSTKQVAIELGLKSNTISTIKRNIFFKLKISTVIEAYEISKGIKNDLRKSK